MAVKDMAASVMARLRNQAKSEGISYQRCLQLFLQEEFLRRLSNSAYHNNLILKGGMFIYTLTDFNSRPTIDIDFMARWISNDVDNIRKVIQDICEEETVNDYIRLNVVNAEQITLENKYPGVKVKMEGMIKKSKTPFSVDIGIDDVITPDATLRKIPTRLDGFDEPQIYTYSVESTVSEKFDSILERMEGTSRMKDFFDIYYLSNMYDFNGPLLRQAMKETEQNRNRELDKDIFPRIRKFPELDFFITYWGNYQPARESGLEFSIVIEQLSVFIEPVYDSLRQGNQYELNWSHIKKCWE